MARRELNQRVLILPQLGTQSQDPVSKVQSPGTRKPRELSQEKLMGPVYEIRII